MSELRLPSARRALLPALAMLAVAAAAAPSRADPYPATGRQGMVVAAHPLAARAGLEILRAGGSAADAAVATALALAVVEPYSSGLGGGGVIVTFDAAAGRAAALDCRETAPLASRSELYLRAGRPDTALSQDGALAVATPGLVRGLWELHDAAGRLPWASLVRPAADLARGGFAVDSLFAARVAERAPRFNAAARAVFLPGGAVPCPGAVLVQPDLAATLDAVAAGGAGAFYTGPVAEAIAGGVRAEGGVLTAADLAGYRAVWREPLRGTYRGLTLWTMPPPSSGGVLLIEMLNVLEGFDLSAAGYGSADAWHPMIEAMKFAFAERSRWLGDPDFFHVPVARLTGRAHADSLRARIRPDAAIPWRLAGAPPARADSAKAGRGHTTHLSVVDRDGNAVAATLTVNLTFGSGLVAPGTGVVLNDEIDDFALAPGVPNAFGLVGGEANAIAPRKRPLSSMTPTIALKDGRVFLVLGSPGGSRIITAVLQVLVNVVDFGMDIEQAVRVPRIHHQWLPPLVWGEPYGISPDTARRLRERGHVLATRASVGNVQAILVDPASGLRTGASDPRGVGEAVGY